MNLIVFALRRPITVLVLMVSLLLGSVLAVLQMPKDIFPALNLPVIYVCQPYGGMDPAQMEGLLTNYYEYHFLYVNGIHHVESKNIQGMALMKLVFHPGTNMPQAMAETISYVNRSRAFMPPGTVSPFVMRFDTGSVPVGYLVLSSESRSLAEIQDLGLFVVRPMFASLPGVSAPPPFGGSARSIVVNVDPDKLRAYRVSPEQVVESLARNNTISPSGNISLDGQYPIVPLNAMVRDIQDLGKIPIQNGTQPAVYLRDLGTIEDAMDLTTGYALANGRRACYILVTKRADASTVSVVEEVRKALPAMITRLDSEAQKRDGRASDMQVTFEFDQSPYVARAMRGVVSEGALGALLTGLMVLVFLRDWRSALVVVINIPLALMGSVIALWIGGHSLNLMTLSGLALAVGILVDEATVEIENIHTQLGHSTTIAHAVRAGNAQTAVPRLLAMLCILAVFIPALFMEGAARALFVPLSLAVGFAMVTSYLLSSTLVPVLSVWLLRHVPHAADSEQRVTVFSRVRRLYQGLLARVVAFRWLVVPAYLAGCAWVIWQPGVQLGREIFPSVDTGQFRLRMRAPDGTHFDRTERLTLDVQDIIKEQCGEENIDLMLGYVGTIPPSFPINAVYQWSRGPEEAILRVGFKRGSALRVETVKEQLRGVLASKFPDVRFSFEPADIINEVMSFGSSTPIEISVKGPTLADSRGYAQKVMEQMRSIAALRDLQVSQSLDYPTIEIQLDRERAGLSDIDASDVARSLVTATSSSRFTMPNYWPDPKTGIGYQVQVQIPSRLTNSLTDLETIPIRESGGVPLLLRDVAQVSKGKMPGQFDRYNMKREITLTANLSGEPLGNVSKHVERAIRDAQLPKDAVIEIRGQIPPLEQLLRGLGLGLVLAVVVIFLLLAANYQSIRLALVTASTAPAAIAGAVLALQITQTTLNLQSFIGAIMAVGVAMANAILLVTFAEQSRHDDQPAKQAAVTGAAARLRPIVMTTCAMIAGMLPMALGMGEGGDQVAPLGRAVIGGLLSATLATLWVLPGVFAIVQRGASTRSASLDPDDIQSVYHTQPR